MGRSTLPVPWGESGYLTFSPGGELFVADHLNGTVLRFLFDDNGSPVSNGTISVEGAIASAFSSTGELFVSSHGFLDPIFITDGADFPLPVRQRRKCDSKRYDRHFIAWTTGHLGRPRARHLALLGLGLAGLELTRRRKL